MRYWLFLLCLFATAALAEPPNGYPFVKYDVGLRQAHKEHKPLFVYFGRYGCGFCAKTNKETFSDTALKSRYIDHYVLVYVDAESGDRLTLPSGERITESELGARLNVFATPIFLYMDAQGDILFRAPGFKTVKDFVDFDRYIQQGAYKSKSINEFLSQPAS